MPQNPQTPITSANAFVWPDQRGNDARTLPTVNPFAGPPEPERLIPEAMQVAVSRAYGEWREYLPHGLSRADYEPYRTGDQVGWLRDLAISSATQPLTPVLTPAMVRQAAEAAADEAFVCASSLLSHYEPD